MLLRIIGYVVAVTLLCSLPAQLDAYVARSMGCHHNGTWYGDRSLVPTMEKCLTCQCQKKTLVCRLKVCPEMPMPPPRGCIVVQQRNSCCPYLSCARLEAFYKIPATRRIIAYLDHYERESIDRVVNDNILQRRSDDSDVDMYVCVKNGTVYKSGSAMSSSNLCTYCYCIGGTEKCVKPKCMLPVEGCKPIFVDSTCCPVRYDCTSKPSGKSSQEVRYRKNSNKHYLRMSQRLQRNRGCTVNQQFYVEGQKMRSDPDKPCDICFCIRGTRRCAPKKCAPALKNCMPVVPKGQCCPSSYDCGTQRAQSSRQFNLFSLLFGKEDELNGNGTKRLPPIEYPPDRHPSITMPHSNNKKQQQQNLLQKNDEKSIFDRIREGLEIIDGNNDEVIGENIADKLTIPSSLTKVVAISETVTDDDDDDVSTQPMAMDSGTSTEVSFLDLLLGKDDEVNEEAQSTRVTEESVDDLKTTTTTYADDLSWVDILLGPDEDDKKVAATTTDDDGMATAETTINYQHEPSVASIDRVDHEIGEDALGFGEIVIGGVQTNGSLENKNIEINVKNKVDGNMKTPTAVNMSLEHQANHLEEATETSEKLVEGTTVSPTTNVVVNTKRPPSTLLTRKYIKPTTKIVTTKITTTKIPKVRYRPTKFSANKTQNSLTFSPKVTERPIELKFIPKTTYKPKESLYKTTTKHPLNVTLTQPTTENPKDKKTNVLLTALLDGFSDMLNADSSYNNTQQRVPEKTNETNTMTPIPTSAIKVATISTTIPQKPAEDSDTTKISQPQPLPSFKPLPTAKPPHMRINSKIANLTIAPDAMRTNVMLNVTVFKPLPVVQDDQIPIVVGSTRTPMIVTAMAVSDGSITTPTTTIKAPTTKSPVLSMLGSTPTTGTTTTTTAKSTSSSVAITNPTTIIIPLKTTTPKPLVIKTNPTILEADPFDNNAQPTLPPSLPNLKIIPFLPTDAVKADRNKLPYDYYHNNSPPTAKIDYDQYDEGNMYPAITEPHFPIYPDEDDNKAEYIYKFNVEGPSPPVVMSSSVGGKLDGVKGATAAAAFVKYDFVGPDVVVVEHKGFSPPTKTEGGFVPKEPLILRNKNDDDDNGGGDVVRQVGVVLPYVDGGYQVTKHIIDITTSEPLQENKTNVIEITTPDPFKDVIRTEPPPDLTSLIEDQGKILFQNPLQQHKQQQPITSFGDPENLSQSLIHITTAEPQPANQLKDKVSQSHTTTTTTTTMKTNNADSSNVKQNNDKHKNTIASFLDLLLGDDIDFEQGLADINVTTTSTSSVVPPFKTLPQAAFELLPNINSTTTTTTAMSRKEAAAASLTTESTTTPAELSTERRPTTTTTIVHASTSTTQPVSTTIILPIGAHKLNATTVGARTKSKTKTPGVHRIQPAVPSAVTFVTTKTSSSSSTTRPKNSRPKFGSIRRQTTKLPYTIGTSYKRNKTITTTTISTTTTNNTSASTIPTTTVKQHKYTTAPTTKPLQRSPFDTLPFMDASFDVKRTTERPFVVGGQYANGDFLDLLNYKNSLNHFEGLEPARESFPNNVLTSSSYNSSSVTTTKITTTTKTTATNARTRTTTTRAPPLVQRNIEQLISAASPALPQSLDSTSPAVAVTSFEVQHTASNSLIDPTGVLKLAGCNIYGRMYRVGRIILELSNPCLECKCTEVGVECGQLDC